jgi:hypothetical protein
MQAKSTKVNAAPKAALEIIDDDNTGFCGWFICCGHDNETDSLSRLKADLKKLIVTGNMKKHFFKQHGNSETATAYNLTKTLEILKRVEEGDYPDLPEDCRNNLSALATELAQHKPILNQEEHERRSEQSYQNY